jgi:hypothetical protein
MSHYHCDNLSHHECNKTTGCGWLEDAMDVRKCQNISEYCETKSNGYEAYCNKDHTGNLCMWNGDKCVPKHMETRK